MRTLLITAITLFILSPLQFVAQNSLEETFPDSKNNKIPMSYDELWKDFNPRTEPLDTEVLYEWEEEGVVLKVLRYRVGVFKGQKSMMAAIYGYPKGATKLPGLVQIHGGGQYADYRAVLKNAKRGYATISISWAGRINAPNYKVDPKGVQLFCDHKTDDPDYKVTTDWGAVDAYHAPLRNKGNGFSHVKAASWTLDTVDSPRNNPWFLCVLGARRALTFLEQQPQVNSEKLGVYGHSMGGKITVLTTGTDSRIKASAPSCGGISDNYNKNELYQNTISDTVYLKHITCPILFLSPSNDFHGHLQDLPKAVHFVKTKDWRVTVSPHHSHQDTPEYEVATLLWFDQHLKKEFQLPSTPKTEFSINKKRVVFNINPDTSKKVASIDVYYLQPNNEGAQISLTERENRFWHHSLAEKKGGIWTADLELHTTKKPLWVYANVTYALEQKKSGAGYYYQTYTTDRLNISSLVTRVSSKELKKVKATRKQSKSIEKFETNWEKEWFTYSQNGWSKKTHKLNDASWKAPKNGKLRLEILVTTPNTLVVGIDKYAAAINLQGENKWQTVTLVPEDFKNALGETLNNWDNIKEFRLGDQETLKQKNTRLKIGNKWKGKDPEFRNLRWLK